MAMNHAQRGEGAAATAPGPWRGALTVMLALLALAAIGCGSGLDPKQSDARYACTTTADCTTGDACVCGFCQPLGVTPSCLASSGGGTDASGDSAGGDAATADTADTASTADTADTTDAADTGSGPCSPRTWQGCQEGDGCYVDSKGVTSCLKAGTLGLNQPCDPQASSPPCGKDGATPMSCDMVDKKCLHLCNTSKQACPKGLQCYELGSPAWPDHAGVCAP